MTMVKVPKGMAVPTQGQHYVQYKKKVMQTKDAPLSSHLADYVLLIGHFLLDLASLKTLLAGSIL